MVHHLFRSFIHIYEEKLFKTHWMLVSRYKFTLEDAIGGVVGLGTSIYQETRPFSHQRQF